MRDGVARDARSVERDGHTYPAVEWEADEGVFELVPEAHLHDERILPHMVQGDYEALFPRAIAAEALEETEEETGWLERAAERFQGKFNDDKRRSV